MKEKLRAQKLSERLQHSIEEKKRKDFLIVHKISALPEFQKAKNILFYVPIQNEVDLTGLFELFKTDKKFLLGRVRKNELDLYFVNDLGELTKGAFGILEPQEHFIPARFSDVDLVLVPGIVFSRNGHRIGYGKGFYDRFLVRVSCVKIGIAYDFQMVNNIDGESHDIAMDIIVTEEQTIRIS